jgi:hypothetical protein
MGPQPCVAADARQQLAMRPLRVSLKRLSDLAFTQGHGDGSQCPDCTRTTGPLIGLNGSKTM